MAQLNLPETLWRESQIVMAPGLSNALRDELIDRGLFQEACGPNPKENELVGGEGADDATKHFTHRFKTSSARVQYLVLSPCGTFDPVASDMMSFILDGKVSVLDIPCGSGGGLLGYLCTIAELRQRGLVPRTPVEITVLAGDISSEARLIHEAMLDRLASSFSDAGIRLSWHHSNWDVTDVFSTSRLVDQWFTQCPSDEEYMIFVSAFSGFADTNREIVLNAFHSIVGRFHNKPCLMVWVEPAMKLSTRVLKWIVECFNRWFGRDGVERESTETKEFHFKHPFTGERIRSHVQVRSFSKEGA
jgi:hypothetical protein